MQSCDVCVLSKACYNALVDIFDAAPNLFLVIVNGPMPWCCDVAGGHPAAALAAPMLAPPANADTSPSPGTPAHATKKGV